MNHSSKFEVLNCVASNEGIYLHFSLLTGFSMPMLLSPELADLMGETHVSMSNLLLF